MTEIERRRKKAEESGKIKTSTQTKRSAASSYSETSDAARRWRIWEEENRKYSAPEANRRAAMQRKTESWMDFTTEAEPEARAAIDRYKATEDAKYYAAMNQRGATIGNDAMQERGFAGYKGAYDLWKTAFDRETDAAAARTRREREMTENPAKAPTVSDIVSRYSGKTKTLADLGNNVRGAIDAYKRQSDAAKAAPTPEEARQQAEESVQYWQNVAREAARYGDVYRQATARKHLADSVENYSRATKGYFDNLKATDPGTYYALTMTPEEIDHELELLNNGAYLDSKITNSLTNDERIMGEYWHRTPQEQRQYEHNLERARFAGETDDERNAYISSEKEAYRDARNRMLNDASVEGSVGSNQEPYNRREEITQANEARKSVLENARLTQKVIQADREGITNDPQIIASGKQKFEADQQGIWDRWVPEQGWTTQAGGVQMDNLANAAEHGYVLDRMDEMTEEQRARIYSLYDRDPETALKLAQTYAKALDDKFYQKIFDWAAKDSGWQFGRRAVGNLAGAVMNLASGLDPFGYGGQSAGKVGDALIGGAAQSATRNGWFGIEELGGDQSWIDSSVPFIGRGKAGEASQLVSSMEQSALTTLPALVAGRYDAAAASWLETAGLLLQSSSAARSDYRESIEAGLDDTTAKIHAVAAGIAEYTFEKVSFDKLLAQNTSRMTFKKVMKDVLVQAGIEGSEELNTTLANTIMDEIISGDGKSKIDRRIAELVQGGMSMKEAKGVAEKEWLTGIVNDFIGGAASGGIMTGGNYALQGASNLKARAVNAAETRKAQKQAGAAVSRSEGSVEALQAYAKDNGIEIKAVETAEQTAGESAEQGHQDGSKQNSYSNRDYRSISDTNSKVVQSIRSEVRGKTVQEQQTIRDNLVEKYGDGIAPVVNQAISVETAARVRQEYGSVDSIQAARNKAVSEIKDESLRQAVSDGYDSAAYALAASQGGESGMNTMSRYIQQRRNTGSGTEMTMNATVTAQDGSIKTIAITGMSEDGKRVSLADGSEVAVKDLQADEDTTSAIQQLADLGLGADATKVLEAYQQSGVSGTEGYRWLMDYATAYNQGRTRQISLEQAAQRSSLDERTVMDAYTLGQQAANRETQAGLEKLKNLPKRKGANGRTANIDTTEIKGKTMSKSELEQFELANQYAQALGVDMKWFSSKEKDGKFVGKNGAYENGKIYMDIHAGRNFAADLTSGILATMGHELTHFQQQYAPEEYQAIKEFLFEQIVKSSPNGEARLERLIWEKQRRSGYTLSRKAAEDEVVADACQKMLRDSKAVHDFASQQPEAANGVVRWLDKWFKRVRSIFGRGGNYSEEAQIMDSLEQDVKAAFGELWDKALKQAAKVHDEVGNIEKETTESESKVQNSDRDAEYLELAKDPEKNKARLQEMVDEAAKRAGYTVRAYHGTNEQFTVFSRGAIGKNAGTGWGPGFYFTDRFEGGYEDSAREYGGVVVNAYLKLTHPLTFDRKTISRDKFVQTMHEHESNRGRWARSEFERVYDDSKSDAELFTAFDGRSMSQYRMTNDDVINAFKSMGFDGLTGKFGNANHTVVFDSDQIKSADPITYDDQGNVIPLSERFNAKNEDIRFSMRDGFVLTPKEAQRLLDGRAQEDLDKLYAEFAEAINAPKSLDPKQIYKLFREDVENDKVSYGRGTAGLNRGREIIRKITALETSLQKFMDDLQSVPVDEFAVRLTPPNEYGLYASESAIDFMYSGERVIRKAEKLQQEFLRGDQKDENRFREFVKKLYALHQEAGEPFYAYGVEYNPKGKPDADTKYSDRENPKPRSAQAQRDAGYKLSESKFYSLYSAHKLNMIGKGNVQEQISSIMADGFKGDGGFGNNVMPTNISYDVDENGKRIPRGLSAQKYAPKKGEYILLVPKEGVEVKGGRYNFTERVKPGYKPAFDYEIVQADYDGQPYYEMYEKAYDKSQAEKADVTLDGAQFSERDYSTPSDEELLDTVQSTELNDAEQKRLLTEYQTLRRQIKGMEKRLEILEENRAKLNEKIQGGKEYSEKYVSIKDKEIENLRREIETSREYLQEKMLTPKLADLLNAQRRNAAAKAKQQKEQAFQKYKEGKKAGELRRRIARHSKELYGKLTKPSDKRHIPEAYRGAVAALLNTINLESAYDIQEGTKNESGRGGKHVEKGTGTATNRTKAFQEVRKQLEKVLAEGGFTGELINNAAEGFDGGLIEKCQDFADKPISTLSSEELETLWNTIRALEHNITTFNKAFALAKNETISGLADSFLASAQKRKPLLKDPKSRLDLKIKKTSGAALKALENPYTFFSHYGEEGIKLYRALRDAQDLVMVRTNHLSDLWVRKMADILGDEKTAKLNGDKLTDAILDKIRDTSKQMDEKVETFKLENGQTITLTHAMLMDVYLLAQRGEVGMNHLLGSGLIQPEIRAKGKYVARDPSFRKLSLQDVQKLTGVITENATEKAIADAIQSMQHQLADWGNEASMAVFGYRKFTEDNYWPVKNAKEENKSDSGKGGNQPANAMNKGMAKNLVPHAATGMEPMSAFTKLQGSISDMLVYATWGPVMEDFKRFYNWKWFNPEGGTSDTVKGVMERYGGEGSQRYWEELRDQINNGVGGGKGSADQLIGKAVGAVKGARVAFNLRVVVQQPTAYARAGEVISGKYLAASLLDIKSWGWKAKSAWNRALTHSPIAMRKDSTTYDMGGNISVGGEFGLDRPGYLDKARDFGTALAGKADAITWGRLWHAAELQISAKTDLEHGSQEYWDAVNKLFTEAVDRTQVVDGLLQRPAIMRTDSDFVKGATSYMGEPLMQLNMLMRQVNDFRQTGFKATKKQIGKTVTALVVTQLFNAMLTGLYDAGIRKDDEDKDFWERFVAEITGLDGTEENAWDYITSIWLESNTTSEMSVMQKIPLVKDVLSMLQGYDPSNNRMDLEAIKDFIDVCTKVLWNDKYTPLYKAKEMINKASMIFGAGFGNALKDMYGVTRNIINDFGKPQARFDFKALWLNPASKKNKSQYFDLLFQMLENGDKDAFRQRAKKLAGQDGMLQYVAKSAIERYLTDGLSPADVWDMMEAARDDGMSDEKFFEYAHGRMADAFKESYFNGKLEDDQAVTLLMQYSGKNEKDAWNAVRKWKDQAKHVGADGKLPDDYKWNQYDELKAEVATGNDISELIQTYKANGYSETQINGALLKSIQEAMAFGDFDEKEAADALIRYGVTYSKDGKTVVYDKQSAWKKVQEWADKAEHTNEEGELEDGYKYNAYSDLFEAVDANKKVDGIIQTMIRNGGYDEDSLRNQIKEHLHERFVSGEISEDVAIDRLQKYRGMDEDEAYWQVDKWRSGDAAHKAGDDFNESNYRDLYAAIDGNKDPTAAMKELTSHGYKERDVYEAAKGYLVKRFEDGKINESQLKNQLSRYAKVTKNDDANEIVTKAKCYKETGYRIDNLNTAYLDGEIGADKFKQIQAKYGGMSTEDAKKRVRWLDVKKANPDLDVSEAQCNTWYDGSSKSKENRRESAKAAGMSIENYIKAKAILADVKDANGNNTGEDEYIAALTKITWLTPRQKDALYYEKYKGTTKYSYRTW